MLPGAIPASGGWLARFVGSGRGAGAYRSAHRKLVSRARRRTRKGNAQACVQSWNASDAMYTKSKMIATP